MHRCVPFGTLVTVLAGALHAAAAQPVPVATGVAQLFIDDEVIARSVDLKRTLHQPRKDDGGNKPLIYAAPKDCLLAYGSIVYDTRLKLWVMFIQSLEDRHMFRLTSKDGMTWDKTRQEDLTPLKLDLDLGKLPPDAKGKFGIDLFSCYYDETDPNTPYKAWVWFANAGYEWEGIWYMNSADGLDWKRVRLVASGFSREGDPSCRVITQGGRTVYGPGDVTIFSYDAQEKRFLGIFKFFNPFDVRPGYSSRSRAYMFLDRMDQPIDTNRITHIELLPAMAERDGDHLYDEYYASTAWRYESLWLGGLKIFHTQGNYPFSAADCAFMKLVVSRDGLHWKKVPFTNDSGVPEVWIPNGPEGGNNNLNDGGYISEFSQGPLRIGDELIYYYSSPSRGKAPPRETRLTGGGIFRARLRVDGFVSVDWGSLTTKLLAFEGKQLTINGIGPVTVRVVNAEGNSLAAATIKEGDSLRHEVTFAGRSLRDLAPDGRASLQFEVTPPGRLYSFTIR